MVDLEAATDDPRLRTGPDLVKSLKTSQSPETDVLFVTINFLAGGSEDDVYWKWTHSSTASSRGIALAMTVCSRTRGSEPAPTKKRLINMFPIRR